MAIAAVAKLLAQQFLGDQASERVPDHDRWFVEICDHLCVVIRHVLDAVSRDVLRMFARLTHRRRIPWPSGCHRGVPLRIEKLRPGIPRGRVHPESVDEQNSRVGLGRHARSPLSDR